MLEDELFRAPPEVVEGAPGEIDQDRQENWRRLQADADEHYEALLAQLLHAQGLDNTHWQATVSQLARKAVAAVRCDVTASNDGAMDPSIYVRVKVIASGDREDSCAVRGVVCRKNVAHRRMRTKIEHPKVMLLGGALEYRQPTDQRLATMDTLLEQEQAHLEGVVATIAEQHPDVLLVEKAVSRFAQESLLEKGVSLVLNVKPVLMERLARCTGAKLVDAVENVGSAQLGTCEEFRVEHFYEPRESGADVADPEAAANMTGSNKTLMFFDGCPVSLGCTIILRGGTEQELKMVKEVMEFAVYAAYHLQLELAFLSDEQAALPAERQLSSGWTPPACIISISPHITYWDEGGQAIPSSTAQQVSSHSHAQTPEHPVQPEMSPAEHQSILVSVSCRWPVKRILCKPPILQCITFYGSNDMPLGAFITNVLFQKERKCQHERCGMDGPSHVRTYTHAHGRLTVSVHTMPSLSVLPLDSNGTLWMWHCCRACMAKHTSDDPLAFARCVRMSSATWSLSFGKFLELSFSEHYTVSALESCNHSLHRDHLRFFGRGDMVACFEYDSVVPLRVHMPATAMELFAPARMDWLQAEATEVAEEAVDVFGELTRKLEFVSSRMREAELPVTEIQALQQAVDQEHATFKACHHAYCLHCLLAQVQQLAAYSLPFCLFQVTMAAAGVHVPGSDQVVHDKSLDVLELNKLRRQLALTEATLQNSLAQLSNSVRKSHRLSGRDLLAKMASTVSNDSGTASPSTSLVDSVGSADVALREVHGSPGFTRSGSSQSLVTSDDQLLLGGARLVHSHSSGSTPLFLSSTESSDAESDAEHDKSHSARRPPARAKLKSRSDSDRHHRSMSGGSLDLDNGDDVSNGHANGAYEVQRSSHLRTGSLDTPLDVWEGQGSSLTPDGTLEDSGAHAVLRGAAQKVDEHVQKVAELLSKGSSGPSSPASLKRSSFNGFAKSPLGITRLARGGRVLMPSGVDDVVIAVYDDEPTSIVAYALALPEFQQKLQKAKSSAKPSVTSGIGIFLRKLSAGSDGELHSGTTERASHDAKAADPKALNGNCTGHSIAMAAAVEAAVKPVTEDMLLSADTTHITCAFEDSGAPGKVKFSVTAYYAAQFEALRSKCFGGDFQYIQSLCRCRKWDAAGGKSNVYFAKTLDDRFVVKQVSRTELLSFLHFAPAYFQYLSNAIQQNRLTCLAKVFGCYQVTSKQSRAAGGKEMKMDIVVLENVLYQRHVSQIFDLKGSMRSRYNAEPTEKNAVLLDENLVEIMGTTPILVDAPAKSALQEAVSHDTAFLAGLGVMDYSLLVGVDEEKQELVVGIIDFIRQYTWDKHLESWVKSSGILGGPAGTAPTVVSPKQYMKRFRSAMSNYFVMVPDQWTTPSESGLKEGSSSSVSSI
eukprot:jgi/Chlat1/2095/Chrsp17S02689